MENKNGKFVGKRDIPFDNDQIADILQLKCRILEMFRSRNVSVDFRQNVPSEGYYDSDDSGFGKTMTTELTVRFTPNLRCSGFVQRDANTHSKRRVSANKPCVHIFFHNRYGFDEVTGEDQTQSCVYVRVFGFQERGYRKHNWKAYDPKPSFGYGFEIDTLWEDTVKPVLEQVWCDVNLLIK